jgi:hypothetical protein
MILLNYNQAWQYLNAFLNLQKWIIVRSIFYYSLTVVLIRRNQGSYLQHYIFFVNYESAH